MPIYLYRCRHCGNKIELLQGMNEKDSELACPQCGECVRACPQKALQIMSM
jgi:putative FmdB family regulatory protein